MSIEEFGDRLRQARRLKQYTMAKLCDKMGGHNPAEVGAWEGGRLPNSKALVDLAKALEVTTDWLLGLSDNGGPQT